MSYFSYENISIIGVSAAVPKRIIHNKRLSGNTSSETMEKFVKITGVEERRITQTLTTSDLCFCSAQQLLNDVGWDPITVDLLVIVSQTRDYVSPSTSCILRERLGIKHECYCVDLTMGCSGWVYGLNYICSLLNSGDLKRAILLTGDSKELENIPSNPLFGHAGSSTAIEYDTRSKGIVFNFGTDGSRFDSIIVKDGACRNPMTQESYEFSLEMENQKLNRLQLSMKGINVFGFSVNTIPKSIKELAEHYAIDIKGCDFLVLHQANKIINDTIAKSLGFLPSLVLGSLNKYGNTSSASIPMSIVVNKNAIESQKEKLFICSGFGVGLSWGNVIFSVYDLKVSSLMEIDE